MAENPEKTLAELYEYYVGRNFVTRVIKPLFLGQNNSTAIIEHGGKWKLKVDQLRKRNLLKGPVLFPVKGPERGQINDLRVEAFEETLANLAGEGIEITLHTEKDRILEFAGWRAH